MKFRSLVVVALAAAIPALACAKPKQPKKGAEEAPAQEEAVVEEEPTITEECVVNVSLFHESVKNKMYADAYGPWWETYTTCPNANKSIYTDGAKIVEALYQATADPAENRGSRYGGGRHPAREKSQSVSLPQSLRHVRPAVPL